MIERKLNKRVYLFNEEGHNFALDKSKVYTVVRIIDFDKSNDHCRHLIVKDDKGHEREVREYCVKLSTAVSSNS